MSLVDEPERERPPGTVETAIWCNRCMLPSAVMLEVPCKDQVSGESVGMMYPIVCIDCGARLSPDGSVIG